MYHSVHRGRYVIIVQLCSFTLKGENNDNYRTIFISEYYRDKKYVKNINHNLE